MSRYAAGSFLIVLLSAGAAAQLTAPELVIDSPRADSRLSGEMTFSARVLPESTRVRQLAFYVDGRLVCRVASPPFSCTGDVGTSEATSTVRALAELADGRRLVQTLRAERGASPMFSSAASAVLVPVQVMDARGRPVGGLQAQHFRILEDGVPQDLLSFSNEEIPAQVLLVLDISASMEPAMLDLKAAVNDFLRSLRPRDVVALAGLNQGMLLLSPPTAERSLTRSAIGRLRTGGGTAFYDGLIRAAALVRRWPNPRALVVFTDGDDVSSLSSFAAAKAALQRNDVALYLVGRGRAFEDRQLQAQLAALADETGGSLWVAKTMSSLGRQFEQISTRLSSQYNLSYTPKRSLGGGEWRRIAVELLGQRRDAVVYTRQGYFAVARSSQDTP